MCGIAGFIGAGLPYDSRAVVRRMVTALRHRGPDEAGEYLDEQATLDAWCDHYLPDDRWT